MRSRHRHEEPPEAPLSGIVRQPAADGFFAPPVAYPASNSPAVWQRLHPYIRQSPLLTRQLGHLSQTGWQVQWDQGRGSRCQVQQRGIVVDVALNDSAVMQALGHEARHAFDPLVTVSQYATDVAYADAMMNNESTAVVNQLQVRNEIFQGSGLDIGGTGRWPAYYDSAMAWHERHGDTGRLLMQVKRMYVWEFTSVHGRPYWEVFVNEWRASQRIGPARVSPEMQHHYSLEAWNALAWEMGAGRPDGIR